MSGYDYFFATIVAVSLLGMARTLPDAWGYLRGLK